jgi:hypothetical protein
LSPAPQQSLHARDETHEKYRYMQVIKNVIKEFIGFVDSHTEGHINIAT